MGVIRIPNRKERIRDLVIALSNIPEGDVITWDNLVFLAEVDRAALHSLLPTVDKHLQAEHGVFLDNVRGEGYKVVPLVQQSTLVGGRLNKVTRLQRKVASTAAFIRHEAIADDSLRAKSLLEASRILQFMYLVERGQRDLNLAPPAAQPTLPTAEASGE